MLQACPACSCAPPVVKSLSHVRPSAVAPVVAKPKPAASVPQSGNSAAPVSCVTAVIGTDCFSVWCNRPWWQSRSCSHREAHATPTRCVPSLSVFSLCLSVCAVDSVLYLSPPCVSKYSLLRSDMSLFERLLMCTVCLCLPVYLCLCVVVCQLPPRPRPVPPPPLLRCLRAPLLPSPSLWASSMT